MTAAASSKMTVETRRVFAFPDRLPESCTRASAGEGPKSEEQGAALEDQGTGKHRICGSKVLASMWVHYVDHALVDRHAAAEGEDREGDNHSPEI